MKKAKDYYEEGCKNLKDCMDKTILKYEERFNKISDTILETIKKGNKIIICGNGGSAAHAQHLAAEFLVRLNPSINRAAFPAISLTLDSSTLTACGNDYSFDEIFSRPLSALGNNGDALILLTTSGNSKNLIRAAHLAKEKDIETIGFLGGNGGELKEIVDEYVCVCSDKVSTIQEVQIMAIHAIANYVESQLLK